jgi:chromate transporter
LPDVVKGGIFMKRVSLAQLGWLFTYHGNLTFGGGTATITTLDRELVEKRELISRDDATFSFALARVTPGTNFLAYCTAFGWQVRGLPGAFIALGASSLPCSIITLFATVLCGWWIRKPLAAIAMHGATAAVVGVMLATGWSLARPFRASLPIIPFLSFILGACALVLFGASPFRVLMMASLLGWMFPKSGSRE